jgi:hypothetical protein
LSGLFRPLQVQVKAEALAQVRKLAHSGVDIPPKVMQTPGLSAFR